MTLKSPNVSAPNTGADPRDHTLTRYVIADATGKILGNGNIPAFMLADQVLLPGGSHVLGTGDTTTQYVTNGVITARPPNPTTLSGMQLSNVPNPSSVTIDAANPQQVTDGEVELSFTQPGTYTIVVSSWPMLDATFKVTQP
jgi:hypothetical protein